MCDAFTPSSGGMVRSPEDEFHNEKTSPIRLRPLAARKKLFSEETGRKYEEAKNNDIDGYISSKDTKFIDVSNLCSRNSGI